MMLSVNEQNFTSVVLESSQPVLVHFWAPWCGLCRLITPFLLKVQSEWEGSLNIVSINADDNFRLANAYRLRSLPTVILFDRGKIVYRLEGFKGREDLMKILELTKVNRFAHSA